MLTNNVNTDDLMMITTMMVVMMMRMMTMLMRMSGEADGDDNDEGTWIMMITMIRTMV